MYASFIPDRQNMEGGNKPCTFRQQNMVLNYKK